MSIFTFSRFSFGLSPFRLKDWNTQTRVNVNMCYHQSDVPAVPYLVSIDSNCPRILLHTCNRMCHHCSLHKQLRSHTGLDRIERVLQHSVNHVISRMRRYQRCINTLSLRYILAGLPGFARDSLQNNYVNSCISFVISFISIFPLQIMGFHKRLMKW